jgi:response regulator RpfG family c-di-GMP phosphodiesterase
MNSTQLPRPASDIRTVLLVDDELSIRSMFRRRLERRTSIRVLDCPSALAALTLLESHVVDLVVSDLQMAGMRGDVFLTEVGRRWPQTRRMLLTAFTDGELVASADFLVFDKTLSPCFVADTIVRLARS